jgi:fructose/tagatose bisphosphate aldolase
MPLVPFHEMISAAEAGSYAVGYFESWSLESLLAVADAAEATRSPVILGFSGLYLFEPRRVVHDPLEAYAAMGLEVCRTLSVPTCFIFNESPYLDEVLRAVDLGFNLVMYSDEELPEADLKVGVRQVVAKAHAVGAAVEAEMSAPPGIDGDLFVAPDELHLTDPAHARAFVDETGVDCLAVNVGQAHLHGREKVHLRLDLIEDLRREVSVPLVLHGASSVEREDLAAAVRLGVRKINVGSVLKQRFLNALREGLATTPLDANPYEALGSGFEQDLLARGRLAMREVVEELLHLFGSAGQA